MATGKEALEKLAELAAKATDLTVKLPGQDDQALSLRIAALHPLQALENVHQAQVRKTIAEKKKKKKDFSPDDEQEVEKEVLGKYYLFTETPPTLVNTEEESTLESQLNEAIGNLKKVKKTLAAEPEDDEIQIKKARETLEKARTTMVEVKAAFKDEGKKVAWLQDAGKILEDADEESKKTLKTRLSEADKWDKVQPEVDALTKAGEHLAQAIAGLARITMLYSIGPFYLFRLLVQYRIEGKDITDTHRRDVSGEVTGHLNKQDWVRDWLAKQMYLIDKEISGWEPNVFFHLKGGRALALLLGEEGENDWDTSIVINPTLPDDQWYALYNNIHDDVLKLLRTAKQEFLVHVSTNADALAGYCTNEILKIEKKEEEADEDLDDFAEVEKESAKAELIDIGIPRRDTIEILEQWHHTKDSLLIVPWNPKKEDPPKEDAPKIPIPGPLYYVEEYVVMVREALSGRSPSLHKTAKRVQRLANVLAAKDIDTTIGEVKRKIPSDLKKALELVGDKKGCVGHVMTLMLKEFSTGYRLHELAGLAIQFDRSFTKNGKKPDHDPIPAKVAQGKEKYLDDLEKKNTWNQSECEALLEHIAFAQTLSNKFEKHFRKRAEYFGFVQKKGKNEADKRRKKLGQLVKALYTASVFRQEERFEVQLAVAGSHAAYLHADYSRDFVDRIDSLDPVTMIDLRYYCYKDADPKMVLDFFVKEPLRMYIGQGDIKFNIKDDLAGMKLGETSKDDEITAETVYLTWPEEVDFGDDFKYKPVILKISVRTQWPEVSFVWGYPVLSLKDLIRDYVEAAALAGEFETKYRLRGTADVLKEMLTHYV